MILMISLLQVHPLTPHHRWAPRPHLLQTLPTSVRWNHSSCRVQECPPATSPSLVVYLQCYRSSRPHRSSSPSLQQVNCSFGFKAKLHLCLNDRSLICLQWHNAGVIVTLISLFNHFLRRCCTVFAVCVCTCRFCCTNPSLLYGHQSSV